MKSPATQHFTIEAELQQHRRQQQEVAAVYTNDEGFLFVQGGDSIHAPVARYTLQQVLQWSESRVCQWVRDQGFGKYEAAFRENLVNGEALVELDYGLLKELSVRTVGERVRLNLAIRRLRQQCLQLDAEFESPPPRLPLPPPPQPQLQQPRAKRTATELLALPSPHSTATTSDLVPPSALHNAHAAAASSVATNAGAVALSLSATSAAGSSTQSHVVASTISAMASVTAASPKLGIKDLPVLPRVSLSSMAIGLNGGSNLQRAKTDMRPFATIQDRRPKLQHHRPQLPQQLHHASTQGGASGVALRKPKPSIDNGSPQPANLVAVGPLPHPLRPVAAKLPGFSAVKETAAATSSQLAGQSLRRGDSPVPSDLHAVEPMSAPLPRLRMLTSSGQQRQLPVASPTVAPLQLLRDAIESNRSSSSRSGQAEEIERLGLQFQEFFGTDISVSNLADSLSVKTWHVTITGPENQVRQVAITNTSSAQAILDRVRREFDLDNDIDGDQYSLFSMTSEGGGARCLSNEELVKMFSSSDSAPQEKFFLRKRHQLSRPPMGSKRSEHLQRAIERLGNIIPATLASSLSPSVQQQSQHLNRSMTKWESTTEKLTKLLGERPPSELVSLNVEKYFPGNEARARHSIMRRRQNESLDGVSMDGLEISSATASKRSSRRQSRTHRRSSSTSSSSSAGSRIMQAKLQALALGGEKRWSEFSSNLEPIEESQASPSATSDDKLNSSMAIGNSGVIEEVDEEDEALSNPPTSPLPPLPTIAEDAQLEATPTVTSRADKRMSKMYEASRAIPVRNESCGSLEFSDDEGDDSESSGGSLSDLSTSDSSDESDSVHSDDDDGSFCKSLDDSDIDRDEDLADIDDDSVKVDGVPSADPATVPEQASNEGMPVEEGAAGGTFGASTEALPDKAKPADKRNSVGRSGSAASRSKSKKKTWIKGAPIASGSFGSVYFGMNTRTGAIMAVKEVELPKPGSVSMKRNQRMADALRHELDLLKGLDHRNVVKYLGTDMDERNIYIFLEYVSGGSVSSALASFGMFPETLVRTYTAQIIEGLVYLHEQGIIHRDIKGGNVLIDQDGSVKISDFGISKRVDEVVAASEMDRRASLQGSVFWMAPEVVKDTKYTVKGDVWSLGCLVIEMMTGTHPFPDLDQLQALYSIGQRGRPKIPDDISLVGQDFLERALQVDLDMRPTAKDLLPHAFVCEPAMPPTP
ncbi:ATP binding [Coemansia sp. RSA 2050]|nr:ATP binding [Coemansia sp. RSA 2050]KAJ2735644.1 ATP binding [Coemansia sp. BCRC 34962]